MVSLWLSLLANADGDSPQPELPSLTMTSQQPQPTFVNNQPYSPCQQSTAGGWWMDHAGAGLARFIGSIRIDWYLYLFLPLTALMYQLASG